MTKHLYRFLLLPGLALALSSCDVFKPDPPQGANEQYGAADAYNTGNPNPNPNANPGGYPPYQQPQGANPNPYGAASGAYGAGGTTTTTPPPYGGYTQPNYNTPGRTPYTQPADTNPYGTGAAPSASGRTHVVASGENLSKIAQRYGTTTDAIQRANNITDPNRVRAGQQLIIP